MSQHHVVLLLGSNIGDRKKNILTAVENIEKNIGTILMQSELIETKPVEFCSSNIFFNFAVSIKTTFSPIQLLNAVKKIEIDMGRKEDSSIIGHFTDRIIDIDIVEYNNLLYKCKKLEVPHLKHLNERDFSKKLIKEIKHKYTYKL